MTYPFGQDIAFAFYPLIGDDVPTIPSAMQSQSPAIYVYADRPSLTDAAAGTGGPIGSPITSWTWEPLSRGWTFTIPAIDDPNPTNTALKDLYYVAINFRLQAAEQIQTVIKTLELERVFGHHKTISVTENDLKDRYPQIDSYTNSFQRQRFISEASSDVQSRLRGAGYEWAKIYRHDRLKQAIVLKTLSMVMLSQQQQPNDKFYVKYLEYKEMYDSAIESLKLEYDSDKDGDPDIEVKPTAGGELLIIR